MEKNVTSDSTPLVRLIRWTISFHMIIEYSLIGYITLFCIAITDAIMMQVWRDI